MIFPCAGTITEKPTATSLPKKKTALPSLNGIPGRQDENWIFQKWKKRQKCCQALMTSPHSAGIIPFLPVRCVLSMTYGSSKSITSFTFSLPEKDSFTILREILEAKDRKFLGATAPAHGLCLLKVYFTPVTKELTEKTICGSYAPWSV